MTIAPAVFLILILSIVGSVSAEKRWISTDGNIATEKPRAEVLSSNEMETLIRFEIPGFWLDSASEEGITYHTLRFPGYSTTQDIGKAKLPVINEFVAIPARAGVHVSIVDYEEVVLDGYNVYPFQKILNIGEKRTKFDIDRAFYGQDKLYPEAVRVSEPGIWRDLRIVNLRVAPMRYNPASGELRVYTNVTVRLEYTGENSTNAKLRETGKASPQQVAMYESSVLNFDEADLPDLGAPPSDQSYDLLIIAEDRFVDDLDDFIDWKTQRGYKSKVVPISTIGTTPVQIRDYAKSEYEDYEISYLLLVGTEEPAENAIPFYIYNQGSYNEVASDYYYALLDGYDKYPEIGVGRFSVMDEIELDNMISKSIAYEANPPEDEWLEKTLLVAHREGAPDGFQGCLEEVRLAEHSESGYYYKSLQPEFTTAYGASTALGGDCATNSDVINYINEGFRLVGYFGHGCGCEWGGWDCSGSSFFCTILDQLDNYDKTPVIFSIACLTGAPGYANGCLGERFTRMDGGAVAYYGATYVALGSDDFNINIYNAILDYGAPTISDATNVAQLKTLKDWSLWSDFATRWIWYGDPTLSVIYTGDGMPPPDIVYPGYGESIETPGPVALDWQDVGRIKGGTIWSTWYNLQLDDDVDFSSPIVDINWTTSEYTTPELTEGLYFWRLRNVIGGMEYGPWSETSHFFVGIPTAVTTLLTPSNNARVVAQEISVGQFYVSFGWSCPINPDEYLFQLDDDPAFTTPEFAFTTGGTGCMVNVRGMIEGKKYYWRVCGRSLAAWPWSDVYSFSYTEDGNTSGKPDRITANLSDGLTAFPNPFNPSTTISFELAKAGHVRLDIFNVNGALITTLADEAREAGRHDVLWNGKDSKGASVASGIYFYRLRANGEVQTKKMMLLR
jgi:hypothetical protein